MNDAAQKSEVTAYRWTSDRVHVSVWSDGWLTDGGGHGVRGGRVPAAALASVAETIDALPWAELPRLIAAAKRLARKGAVEASALRAAVLPRRLTAEESDAAIQINARRRHDATAEHMMYCRNTWCRICS